MRKNVDLGSSTDRWTTEDRVVSRFAKLTGINNKKVGEVGWRISGQTVVGNTCKFVLNGLRENVFAFRNSEDKTSCIIVLNLLKMENQRLGAAKEERVTVVNT